MHRTLKRDLAHLSTLAFRRHAHCAPLLKRFFALKRRIAARPEPDFIWNIYDWLLVPLSLWPLDFQGLATFLLDTLKSSSSSSSSSSSNSASSSSSSESPHASRITHHDKISASQHLSISAFSSQPSTPQLSTLLALIPTPPVAETQFLIASFEHEIESGRYEKMLKQAEKFAEQEKALLQDAQFTAAWAQLKSLFPIKKYQNSIGVIRRLMSQERNFRDPAWQFDWSDPDRRFQTFFDALCYRWKLYGMQHDRPLLLKISINPTPHGTMIFIPRHVSLDPRRDLDWNLINRLHRCRGAKKQGPKWSAGRIQKLEEAKAVHAAWKTARKQGLKGADLHEFICAQTNHDIRSDPSWWKRLLRRK